MVVNGGELLARSLSDAGVRHVFTLHGGHLDAFLTMCDKYSITLTDTRDEASAGHAADAYARVTGTVGVCVVTSGPGFTNAYTAITNAYLDRVPTLFIVGGPPLRESETNPLQGGFDQIAAAETVTKWAHRITDTARVPETVALALRKAAGGAPGPVLLEIPIDVMFGEADESRVRYPAGYGIDARPGPDQAVVARALDLLATAKNPAIVIGGGVAFSGAGEALVAFAEAVGVPVFYPNKSDGAIPASHRLAAGSQLGALGAAGEPTPDVVVLAGVRSGMFTGGRASLFPGARIVHIDVDASEIGRMYDVAVPIVADCRATLQALAAAAVQRSWPDWSAWATAAVRAQRFHESVFVDPRTATGRLHPYFAAKAVVAACPPGTTFVLDGAEAPAWASFFVRTETIGSVLRTGYLGCLGVGPGFAIGVHRARPDAPVVLITGDGAAGFHLGEFDTMARHGMPVVTVVFNNACWGMSIHGQQAVYGDAGVVVSRLADSSYEKVAEAFGGRGERVGDIAAIPGAMKRALAAGVPSCVNLEIDPDIVHPVTTTLLGDVTTTDHVIVPYYENIPR
jgi:acetolactate synthase-1/2/3 large subunit